MEMVSSVVFSRIYMILSCPHADTGVHTRRAGGSALRRCAYVDRERNSQAITG
jgi:hypothetical protein